MHEQNSLTADQARRLIWNMNYPEQEALMAQLMVDFFSGANRTEDLAGSGNPLVEMWNNVATVIPANGCRLMLAIFRRMGKVAHEGVNATYDVSQAHQLQRLAVNPELPQDTLDQLITMGVQGVVCPLPGGSYRPFTSPQIDAIVRGLPPKGALLTWVRDNYGVLDIKQRTAFALRFAQDPSRSERSSGMVGGNDPADVVFQKLAGDPLLPEEAVRALWSTYTASRWMLVWHPALADDLFQDVVAEMADPERRAFIPLFEQLVAEVFKSDRLDTRYLHLFFADKAMWKHIARNPNLPINMAYVIRAEENHELHRALLANRGLDAAAWNDVLDDFLKYGTPIGNLDAMLNPQISYDNLLKLYRSELRFPRQQLEWFFVSPAADETFRKEVIKRLTGTENEISSFCADLLRKYPELFTPELAELAKEKLFGNTWEVRHAKATLEQMEKAHAK